MLDVVVIVSSDTQVRLGSKTLMQSGITRSVQLYRSGAECLVAIKSRQEVPSAIVIIDACVNDISPLNLADAVRTARPDIDVILAVADSDDHFVERAMLAGARAAVYRTCSDQELLQAMDRVIKSRSIKHVGPDQDPTQDSSGEGVVILTMGARGGAGRSTVSSLIATSLSESDCDTALVDLDLQFGDLGFLFDATHGPTLYDLLRSMNQGTGECRSLGRPLSTNLTLYVPEASPEKADLMSGFIRKSIGVLRSNHDAIVINTGAFWTLFQAELLDACDVALCVFDQTIVGTRATNALLGLCQRLGAPKTRILCVMNRYARGGLSAHDMCAALGIDTVHTVSDKGRDFSADLECGSLYDHLLQRPELLLEVAPIIDDIVAMTGLNIQTVHHMRSSMRRSSRLWRRS